MLKINKTKSFYTFDTDCLQKQFSDDVKNLPPCPKVTLSTNLSFEKWKEKYKDDIEDIIESLLQMVMQLSSENFTSYLNIGNLKEQFIRKLYKTSYNKQKNY